MRSPGAPGPDAIAVLAPDGTPAAEAPFPDGVGQVRLGDASLVTVRAGHGDWELRAVRVQGRHAHPGVVLTGAAVRTAPHDPVLPTAVDQGVDVCVAAETAEGLVEEHSELRILIPYDATIGRTGVRGDDGRTTVWPHATVRDVPAGYPVVVVVRRGADAPAIPQSAERPHGPDGRPVRIWQTGSAIPQVEVAPAPGGGHRIDVRWPDRRRDAVLLPA